VCSSSPSTAEFLNYEDHQSKRGVRNTELIQWGAQPLVVCEVLWRNCRRRMGSKRCVYGVVLLLGVGKKGEVNEERRNEMVPFIESHLIKSWNNACQWPNQTLLKWDLYSLGKFLQIFSFLSLIKGFLPNQTRRRNSRLLQNIYFTLLNGFTVSCFNNVYIWRN
jgi:hypothetical protein